MTALDTVIKIRPDHLIPAAAIGGVDRNFERLARNCTRFACQSKLPCGGRVDEDQGSLARRDDQEKSRPVDQGGLVKFFRRVDGNRRIQDSSEKAVVCQEIETALLTAIGICAAALGRKGVTESALGNCRRQAHADGCNDPDGS